jgi:hypothetical protein
MDNKSRYYVFLGASITVLIGSGYLLYKLFIKKKEEKLIIPKINKRMELQALITKRFEEYFDIINDDISREARKILLNTDVKLYNQQIEQLIIQKHKVYVDTQNEVLAENKVSLQEYQKLPINFSNSDFENYFFFLYKPKFMQQLPNKIKVKEAYIFHCNKVYENLKEKVSMNQHNNKDAFDMLMFRLKLDDEIFFKYNFSFNQMKYLLYHYNLIEKDTEVKKWSALIEGSGIIS